MTLLIKVFFICISVCAVLSQNTARNPPFQGPEASLLDNPRYLDRLLKCILGEVTCDSLGRRLKFLAPSVLRGNCPQCTPTEYKRITETIVYIQTHKPSIWATIIKRFSTMP